MRLKLDENMPADAQLAAGAQGHDVDTVVDEGLGGRNDGDVLQAATRDNRILVTLDRGFGDVRRYRPGTHAGIVVLRVDAQYVTAVVDVLSTFLSRDDLGELAGSIVIVRGRLVRIRRPG